MAETAEKTLEPTPHRRQKARDSGSLVRSQDLASAAMAIVAVGLLLIWGGSVAQFLVEFARRQLGGEAWLSADAGLVVTTWKSTLAGIARAMLPILGLVVLAAIGVSWGQTGFVFFPGKIGFDSSRIDPLAGLQRVFSAASLVRLGFAMLKVAAVVAVAGVCLHRELPRIMGLGGLEPGPLAQSVGQLVLWTALKAAFALLVLAILDYAYQRWRHEQDLRMTPQEVREEIRNLEGDPQIAARRKATQRQFAIQRSAGAVEKADVLIGSPDGFLVAIRYDESLASAPVVIAKGSGATAEELRRRARARGIPLVENEVLARALFRSVRPNRPIPTEHYAAVAEVLAGVGNGWQVGGPRV
jgi:flagellar biosynthesis protein FlhB